jgi:fatty-acid peroxygenase
MSRAAMPSDIDGTWRFLRDGYAFVSNRCRELGSDRFRTRLALVPFVCARGPAAAALVYDAGAFTRAGALPPTTLRLLQGRGSVQTLDDDRHRSRKALFMRLAADPDRIAALVAAFREAWVEAAGEWRRRGRATAFVDFPPVFAKAARRWAGLPDAFIGDAVLTRALWSMIEASGSLGPRLAFALVRRNRLEARLRDLATRLREGDGAGVDPASPLAAVARHADDPGGPLSVEHAAVEIVNLLRPIAAVARFAVFAALELGRRPDLRVAMAEGTLADREAFAEEVRRFHPFFPAIAGRARRTVDWDGHRFRPGDRLLVDLYGTNHHPGLHNHPEAFRTDRGLSWRDPGFSFAPQGAGDHATTHRCPGEAATVALLTETVGLLAADPVWRLPPQDLSVSLARLPARPRHGVRMDFGPG